MPTQVRETAAGKSLSAYVILDKKGRHVADVHAHFSNGGTCTVDVWNHGDTATKRTAEAMGYVFDAEDRIAGNVVKGQKNFTGQYAYKVAGLQQGRAGGYGYDKFTAALAGLVIDGHKLTDHCGDRLAPPKGRLWRDTDRAKLARKGYSLANWRADGPNGAGWCDAYREPGLEVLRAFGYRVIKAI